MWDALVEDDLSTSAQRCPWGLLWKTAKCFTTLLSSLNASCYWNGLCGARISFRRNFPTSAGHSLCNVLSDVTGQGHTEPAETSHTGCSVGDKLHCDSLNKRC